MRNVYRNKTGLIPFYKITRGSFAFLWEVTNGGYKLDYSLMVAPLFGKPLGEQDKNPPWLIQQGDARRRYPPLSKETLHRDFAALKGEREAILQFAATYGFLGIYTLLLAPQTGGEAVFGESLSRWETESLKLGVTLAIWDAVRWHNTDKLEQIIDWSDKGVALNMWWEIRNEKFWLFSSRSKTTKELFDPTLARTNKGKFELEWLALHDPEFNSNLLRRWKKGDVLEPALYYVCKEINSHLAGHVHQQILPFRNNQVCLVPDSLSAALWLLFMWEVSGEAKVLLCPACGRLVEQKHRRQRYCDRACRQWAYRERKAPVILKTGGDIAGSRLT